MRPDTPTPLDLDAIDAAIVDLDGTLIDTLGDFVVVLNAVLDELGLRAVGRSFVERTVGKGSEHLIRATLVETGGAPELYAPAWAAYQAHYRRINGLHAAVFPGVVEGLEGFRARGWRLACLTNKPTGFAVDLLRKKGLDRYFELTFGGDAFARKKPDPLPLLETCQALGTAPKRTLMIGDSSNDAQAARAAGCPVVLVSYGYNHGEPVESAGADRVVDRLDRLRAVGPG